jgi:hypothetical protein
MDYEVFYKEYADVVGLAAQQLKIAQNMVKRAAKSTETGDLKTALKSVETARTACDQLSQSLIDSAEKIQSFDLPTYLESGDYAQQVVSLCQEKDINIKGEGNIYEIFPFRLKISPSDAELTINNKKITMFRPRALADYLKQRRETILSASFDAAQFATELASAYDHALLAASSNGKPAAAESDVYLTTLYEYLTPMKRFRKDYTLQNYALDLSRLYAVDSTLTDDGRRFQFGPSRNIRRSIRIVDAYGQEQFLAVIRFFRD